MYVLRIIGTDKYISKQNYTMRLVSIDKCTTYKNKVGANSALSSIGNYKLKDAGLNNRNEIEIVPVRLIVDE